MRSETDLMSTIEAYLNNELSKEDKLAFEKLRAENPVIDHQVVQHLTFLKTINMYADHHQLVAEMNKIHSKLDVESIKANEIKTPSKVVSFFKKYKNNISIAASVTIFTVLSTLLFTGQFKTDNSSGYYSALRRDIQSIKQSQNDLIRNVNSQKKGPLNPGQFGGTGFALTSSGYLLTNYHVIKDADSVYIQNNIGDQYKVKTIFIDPAYDLAVLQIVDSSFKNLDPLPYSFKKPNSDLGEDVYTIGYPRDDMVYGKGYLSANTGFGGDTIAYQVSIPVNPGNSGGPLLDGKGNIIGIISGKQNQVDGAAFAIKSDYLLRSIASIPQDSLAQKLNLSKKNSLSGLSRARQIEKMKDFIFIVKVYN